MSGALSVGREGGVFADCAAGGLQECEGGRRMRRGVRSVLIIGPCLVLGMRTPSAPPPVSDSPVMPSFPVSSPLSTPFPPPPRLS